MAESIPLHPVEYPASDGQPMPDGDYQGGTYRYLVEALRTYFHTRPDVYVSGDLFVYLEEGNPRNCVAPDLFVAFGAGNHKRDTYKVWEEPAGVPDFVLEIVSPSTWRTDLGAKRERYAALGITEYWLHDPHGRYLSPALAGQRLVDGAYVPLPASQLPEGPSIHSDALGLDLRLDGERLRYFDPVGQEYLRNLLESEGGRLAERAGRREEQAGRLEEQASRLEERAGRRQVEDRLAAAEARIAELERTLRQTPE